MPENFREEDMIPAAFEYHRPDTVENAVKILSDLGDEATAEVDCADVAPSETAYVDGLGVIQPQKIFCEAAAL